MLDCKFGIEGSRATAALMLVGVLAGGLTLVSCGGASQQSAAPATTDNATAPAPTPMPEQNTATETPPATSAPAAERHESPSHTTAENRAPRRPRAETERSEAPRSEPAPERKPEPVMMTVPQGAMFDVALIDPLSSKTSQVGDAFRARVTADVMQDGHVVIPAGAMVHGTVTEAVSLKKIGGTAKLGLQFTQLELPSGGSSTISATFSQKGKSETKKDAATIGGATAGGALLGRLLKDDDKGKGTVIGAVVGAAAGTAIAAKTKGQEIELAEGATLSLTLSAPAEVAVNR